MKTRLFSPVSFVVVVGALLLSAGAPLAQAERENPAPVNPAPLADVRAVVFSNKIYLPMIIQGCTSTGETYGTWPREAGSPATDRPAEYHADLNLTMRGYSLTSNGPKDLVSYGNPTDPGHDLNAPQLRGLFSDSRLGVILNNYRSYDWDWPPPAGTGAPPYGSKGGIIPSPPVTLIGLQVTPGENIHVPYSGYTIGGGYEVRVLYAAATRITFTYTALDNIATGYAIHVENVCIDPSLLASYNSLNAGDRNYMPALVAGEAFGRAIGNEIIVAMRDTGAFMDTRSCTDWWQDGWPC